MRQGASQGEEAVLADSGRAGEITARVGRVRSPAFLSILLGGAQGGVVVGVEPIMMSPATFNQERKNDIQNFLSQVG